MEKSKRRMWQIIVFVVLEMVVLGAYFIGGRWIKEEKRLVAVREKEVVADYKLLFEIEEVEEKDGEVQFSGWAFYPDAKNKEIALELRNEEGDAEHILFADMKEKEGITDYFLLNEKSGKQGFETCIKKSKLDEESCYEVFVSLLYEIEKDGVIAEFQKKVATSIFYYDGKIYCYNPKEFKEPEVSNEELIRVIEDGEVRLYDSDEGIWVYQEGTKLYYLVDSNKNRICEETKIDIPVMPWTSCLDLLPEGRQQYGNDHLGAYYADEKYENESEKYIQVVEIELPTEYPLTYIATGLYDNIGKEWKKMFLIPMFDWRMYDAK